jgi:hypothetical protein
MAYDRLIIRDLGSRNGVQVNGRSVEEARLHCGDELAIGPILFRLEAEEENPEALGAPASRPASSSSAGRPGGSTSKRKTGPPRPRSSGRPDSDIDLVPLDDD